MAFLKNLCTGIGRGIKGACGKIKRGCQKLVPTVRAALDGSGSAVSITSMLSGIVGDIFYFAKGTDLVGKAKLILVSTTGAIAALFAIPDALMHRDIYKRYQGKQAKKACSHDHHGDHAHHDHSQPVNPSLSSTSRLLSELPAPSMWQKVKNLACTVACTLEQTSTPYAATDLILWLLGAEVTVPIRIARLGATALVALLSSYTAEVQSNMNAAHLDEEKIHVAEDPHEGSHLLAAAL